MTRQLPPKRARKRGKVAELQDRIERLERQREEGAALVGRVVLGTLDFLLGMSRGPGFKPGDRCIQCKEPATRANKAGYPACNLYPQCQGKASPAKDMPR